MAQQRKPAAAASARKTHGPKRHLFKEFKPMVHTFAKAGLLNKYNNEESFMLAVAARGNKRVAHEDWASFQKLSFEDKKAYFASIKK